FILVIPFCEYLNEGSRAVSLSIGVILIFQVQITPIFFENECLTGGNYFEVAVSFAGGRRKGWSRSIGVLNADRRATSASEAASAQNFPDNRRRL
ncbi:MAG TPA: hypothetical protein VMM56_05245, partial [Planctomycetaceae bacterium]|nr:hypothetical protein [Planctomycetaceae bacterium]